MARPSTPPSLGVSAPADARVAEAARSTGMARVPLRIPASWIAIAAFFALVALPRPAIPLIDGDVYWHIRAGEAVLETGRVPTHDTWSIVGQGMRWISQDWLSNVALALGYRLGESGPTVLSVAWALLVVIGLAFLWWAYRLRRQDAGWLARIVWLAAGLIVAGPTLGVRVQVVDLTLAAAVLLCLWGYLVDRRARWLVALPLISVAWANLHAGWPLLFLLGSAVVVGELADGWLGRRPEGSTLMPSEVARLGLALAVSAAAIAINPNGLALYGYPLATSSIAAHRDYVSEWQPPDPGTFIGQAWIVFTLLFAAPAVWVGRRSLRAADLLIIVGITAMTMLGARFYLMAPLTAVCAGLALEPALARSRLGRMFGPMLARLGRARGRQRLSVLNALLVAAAVVAGMAVTYARVGPAEQIRMVAEHMPVAAVNWILANDVGDRPLNQYSWGGYLGLRQPNELIYIDGRSDIYGDGPIREYAEAVTLETDPQVLLDAQAIDYVLFPLGHSLAGWLDDSRRWQRVYADDLAGVWVRAPGR